MTILYPSPVFGPVSSRRLGTSLGINLLPGNGKICSFDCIYCECGFNTDRRTRMPFPSREEVVFALENKLKEMKANALTPDVLTFAGNGEPTLHPQFAQIIDDTLALRNKYFPSSKVSVLSNATCCGRSDVFKALNKVDNNILKLDTINEQYIRLLNRPVLKYSVDETIAHLKAFNGHCIIQTIFLKGFHKGVNMDNTTNDFVLPWLETLKEIAPGMVMIYTIARETPASNLQKATPNELDRIAKLINQMGMPVSTAY